MTNHKQVVVLDDFWKLFVPMLLMRSSIPEKVFQHSGTLTGSEHYLLGLFFISVRWNLAFCCAFMGQDGILTILEWTFAAFT